jgi:hypothetical protein
MKEKHKNFIIDLIAGGTSAVISKTVMAPVERYKMTNLFYILNYSYFVL